MDDDDSESIKSLSPYKRIFIANAILSFADGFYHPFLIGFLYRLGGIPLVGSGLGLLLIFASIGRYFAGKWADKCSSKLLFLISSSVNSVVFIAYPLLFLLETIDHSLMLLALFLILLVHGTADGTWGITETVYLANITSRTFRGKRMGYYWGAGGVISGAAMFGGGFLGLHINFLTAALIVVFLYWSVFILLLRIKETEDKK